MGDNLKTLKLCMLGSRGHYNYVFQSIADVPHVNISGISSGCEDSIEPLLSNADKHGFNPQVYDNYRKMLDKESPDIVCIDGPFDLHAEMCMEAIGRDINIFCEKPIALTLDDLHKIEALHAKHPVKLISMVGMRYEPAFYMAQTLLKSGRIGKVKLIQVQKSYKLKTRPDYYKERSSYGGTIPWVGSHAIDLIMFFGGNDFSSVYASQTTSDNFGYGELEIAAQCHFVMKSGLMASASLDFLRPEGAETHGDDRIRIAGTHGVIEIFNGNIIVTDSEKKNIIDSPASDREIFSDFVFDVSGERKALVDAEQTFLLTNICLQARQSADTGQIIHL